MSMKNMLMAAAANSKPAPPAPGGVFEGGYYVGTITDGGKQYALIAAPKVGGETTQVWDANMYYDDIEGWIDLVTTGITSTTNGPGNTTALVNGYGSRHAAAIWCENLVLGGKSDWYLPSKDELNILYAAKAAMASAGQAFVGYGYWSSTEVNSGDAWCQYFNDGGQDYYFKVNGFYVRAVRRLAI